MFLNHLFLAELACCLVQGGNDEGKGDDATDRVGEDDTSSNVRGRYQISESDGKDGDIAKVQLV